MSEAPPAEEIANKPSNIKRYMILLAFVTPMIADLIFHRSALVTSIPYVWTLTGIIIGLAFGGCCSWVIAELGPMDGKEFGHLFTICLLPIFGAFLGTFGARTVFEATSFWGYQSEKAEMLAEVKSIGSKRGYTAEIEAYPGARNIWVDVDSDLYSRLDPYRQPGRDCLLLPVEIGRNGVRRFVIPARFFDKSLPSVVLRMCNHET